MAFIEWTDECSVSVRQFDDDHKMLYCISSTETGRGERNVAVTHTWIPSSPGTFGATVADFVRII